MFELALKSIEEKIKSEKFSREHYEKEIKRYQEYHSAKILDIEALEKEYEALKDKLGIKETE